MPSSRRNSSRDLSLNPSSLGLLTSAYFLAFGAAQLPVGMLLDRYGPRRVEPVLLSIAALGAMLFAYAESLAGLAFARAVIGLGVCACLMAPLKAIATWYPRGAAGIAVGLDHGCRRTGRACRDDAAGIGVAGSALANDIRDPGGSDVRCRARDRVARARHRQARARNGLSRAVGRRAHRHPSSAFLVDCAAGGLLHGIVHGDPGPVGGAMDDGSGRADARGRGAPSAVDGRRRPAGLTSALGFFGTELARRGVHARHLFAAGFAIATFALAGIFLRLPGSYFWWSLYGLGSAVNVLAFTVLNEGFGRDLVGRTNTTLNLLDVRRQFCPAMGHRRGRRACARANSSYDDAAGLRLAFGLVLVGNVLAYAWFLRGWRRHASLAVLAQGA